MSDTNTERVMEEEIKEEDSGALNREILEKIEN
jgi:hypothetical protein